MSKEIAPARYHPLHAALHWLIALQVFKMPAIGKLAMPGFPADHPLKLLLLQTHMYLSTEYNSASTPEGNTLGVTGNFISDESRRIFYPQCPMPFYDERRIMAA